MNPPKLIIIPNEDYLTKDIILKLAEALPRVDCYLLDADRKDLKTSFEINAKEENLFKEVFINQDFGNDEHRNKNKWIIDVCCKVNPDAVVTFTAANFSYRCIRKWSSKLTIFIVQSAYLNDPDTLSFIRQIKAVVYNILHGSGAIALTKGFFQKAKNNIYLVWSKHFIPPGRGGFSYTLTGNPKLDPLFTLYKETTEQVKEPVNALYITQPITQTFGQKQHEYNIKLLAEILKLKEGLNLNIKLHPRDKRKDYDALEKQFNSRINWAETGADIIDLINASDLLFTHFSTVIDSAVVLDVPVFCLDPLEVYANKLPVKEHFIAVLNSVSDFNPQLNLSKNIVKRQKERDLYLQKVTTYTDGKSFERLKEAIADKLLTPA